MSCLPAVAAALSLLGLAGCSDTANGPAARPSFYADLGQPGASIDAAQARAMISAYRINAGLPALRLDAGLQAAAAREAEAMAAADRPGSSDAVKQRLAAAGLARPEANLSAGYRTLAEAFSGWRDSPPHDRVMKASGATRMGIATAYAPGSKYKVYWALVLAGD
jgi:uncharacterized protein YkwD